MSSKIYHLFKASSYLLVKQMISNFLQYTSVDHHFIIFLDSDEWKVKYETFFASLSYCSYEYVSGGQRIQSKIYSRLLHPIVYRGTDGMFTRSEIVLYSYLEECSYSNLLIHGDYMFYGNGIFRALCLSRIKHKAWVCWGAIPPKNKKSFFYPITYGYYRDKYFASCSFINTLLEGDQADLKLMKVNKKITLCPYIIDTPHIEAYYVAKQKKVLVGNSGLYIGNYKSLLSQIRQQNIHFTFMMSYGCSKEQQAEFLKDAASYLGDSFELWTKNLEMDEYLKKLCSFSVYICNVERQTGLGAIQACLLLGLRCYLIGKNLEHFRYLGFKVHSMDELNGVMDWKCIFSNDYENEVEYNKRQWMKVFDPTILGKRWDKLFSVLER